MLQLVPTSDAPRDLTMQDHSTVYAGLAMKKLILFRLTCNLGAEAYQWSSFKRWVR